jgi:hypothetical protein
MSTAGNQVDVDTKVPDDDVDFTKVSNLTELGSLAASNTSRIRRLQRELVQARQDPEKEGLIEPLEQAIIKRQHKSMAMIRRRQVLQGAEDTKKRNALEEALRPTSGALNNDRRAVVDKLADIHRRVESMRGKFTQHTPDQRQLEARLKKWDSTLLMMIQALDNLPALPTTLD